MTNKNYGLATLGVRAGQTPDPVTGAQKKIRPSRIWTNLFQINKPYQ